MSTTRRSFFTRLAGAAAAIGLGVPAARAADVPTPNPPAPDATVLLFGQPRPMEQAARWWCELNAFKWPTDFPPKIKKPDGFDDLPRSHRLNFSEFRLALEAVAAVVPRKEKARYWNTVQAKPHLRLSPAAFEEWWAESGGNHIEWDNRIP